ncbi:TIGR04222 domain-containing membrane protein [filamentous cyanobacterium LEGE 11480]|uniref:TIGR04222 domain-containing membrane protein n=1 Tax=Romeriopsis navalis LEGE 11480 TaxID=2777977 RepID=A0A928VW94_9CYAN|nr:TIGR04222 domain-containing membrane protein [Romeriopsis navalis]MBE9033329.1 TIGR04222 domain-containing membrane protein [Romeriopsis navalis LEGE 11480]
MIQRNRLKSRFLVISQSWTNRQRRSPWRNRSLRTFSLCFLLANLMVSCKATGFAWNPLDMGGWTFLFSYVGFNLTLAFVCFLYSEQIRESDNRESATLPPLHAYELAYLVDADTVLYERVGQTVLTQLFAQGKIQLTPDRKLFCPTDIASSIPLSDADRRPLEKVVTDAVDAAGGTLSETLSAVNNTAEPVLDAIMQDWFEQLDLIVNSKTIWKMRNLPYIPLALSGLLGLVRIVVDIQRGQSVWLFTLVWITALGLVLFARSTTKIERTEYGNRVLKRLQTNCEQQDFSQIPALDLPKSVALLGPHILEGSALSDLYAYFYSLSDSEATETTETAAPSANVIDEDVESVIDQDVTDSNDLGEAGEAA